VKGSLLLFAGIFCSKGFPVLREGNSLMYRQRSVSGTELGLSMMISGSPGSLGLPSPRQEITLRVGRIFGGRTKPQPLREKSPP